MADNILTGFGRPKRLASTGRLLSSQVRAKQEIKKKLKKVKNILKKCEAERTEEEVHTLGQLPEIVKTAEKNAKRQLQLKERVLEIEDDPALLDEKCRQLARMIQSAKNAILYTGAGISTAASIPDYRGPNGVWTLLKKGQALRAQDLVDAEPTYTHMCIAKLFKEGKVKHLVSQNCDGLHVRSGFPRHSLSEVHGNMFIEICKSCKPQKEHLRLFDVTERTSKGRHKTGRTCSKCGGNLYDSIVHFGEKGGLKSPYKWRQAAKAASKSDLIICLGSSLKVLRCYPCLWRMDMRPEHRPNMVIVNLQWTPKDERASLKIHGRCDDVLRRVAHYLGLAVPQYRRETDPLFRLHTPVKTEEKLITSKRSLQTSEHKSAQQNNNRNKVSQRVPSNGSSAHHHHPKGMKTEQDFKLNHTGYLALDSAALYSHSVQNGIQHKENVYSVEQTFTHSESEAGHILDPVRLKLEEMLKSRGLWNKTGNETDNGQVNQTEGSVSCSMAADHLASSSSLLPSIQNFLPQSVEATLVPGSSYPQLRTLLNVFPSDPADQDHDVFRVDLSTNPISITSTHCAAHAPSAESISVSLGGGQDSQYSGASEPQAASSSSCTSNYAKLLRRIQFDHAYCKNPRKSRSSNKKREPPSDSTNCSTESQPLQQRSGDFSGQPVIPVYSDASDLIVAQQSLGLNTLILNDQEILSAVWQVMSDLPDDLDLQVSQGQPPHHPLRNLDGSASQEKVIVNLNGDAGISLQPHLQPFLSAMQVQPSANYAARSTDLSASYPVISASYPSGAESLAEEVDVGEYDESAANVDFPVRQKDTLAAVPGWFGKGLRVRRKRTM
ncbi:uncharacterized protein [Littorina saxatilis]|uniref:protein acetyllysine N-acetyltransferase n=1 Tax=Littorina saxatilis TaxID=31220 RepID=A0AAN9GK84_9CAEN